MAAEPGRLMPMASAMQHMELAVAMCWQEPMVGQQASVSSSTSSRDTLPAWYMP